MNEQMIMAQISDPHLRTDGKLLRNRVDSLAAMTACVGHLNRLSPRPDVVVVTGDLVDQAHDYPGLRRMLEGLHMPYLVIPGNHDFPHELRATFNGLGFLPPEGFLHYVVDTYPIRLIALDTSVPDAVEGALCRERLDWLEERLSEEPRRPTAIIMHHPPMDTGIAFMDRKRLCTGAKEMEKIIKGHPQVERILCGHVHRPVTVRWAGTVVSVAPSVSFQMKLDLSGDGPSGYVMEPAACAVYLWRPSMGLAGHLSVVGDYGPPHSFKENSE